MEPLKVVDKYAIVSRIFFFDFTDYSAASNAALREVLRLTAKNLSRPGVDDLQITAQVPQGMVLQFTLTGGTAPDRYVVDAVVRDSDDQILQMQGILRIVEPKPGVPPVQPGDQIAADLTEPVLLADTIGPFVDVFGDVSDLAALDALIDAQLAALSSASEPVALGEQAISTVTMDAARSDAVALADAKAAANAALATTAEALVVAAAQIASWAGALGTTEAVTLASTFIDGTISALYEVVVSETATVTDTSSAQLAALSTLLEQALMASTALSSSAATSTRTEAVTTSDLLVGSLATDDPTAPDIPGLSPAVPTPDYVANFIDLIADGGDLTLGGALAYSRASTMQWLGKNNVLDTYGTNVPILSFCPITKEPRGIVGVQGSLTQVAKARFDFNDAAWVKNNVTVVGPGPSLDGVNPSTILRFNTAGATITQSFADAVSNASCFQLMAMHDPAFTYTGTPPAEVGNPAGVDDTSGAPLTITCDNFASTTRIGGALSRFDFDLFATNKAAAHTNPVFGIRSQTAGMQIIVSHPQCVRGTTMPTPFLVGNDSVVPMTIPQGRFTLSLASTPAQSVAVDYYVPFSGRTFGLGTDFAALQFERDATNYVRFSGRMGGSNLEFRYLRANVDQFQSGANQILSGYQDWRTQYAAIRMASNDMRACQQGSLTVVDTAATLWAVQTGAATLRVADNCVVSRIRLWNVALTDAELQSATKPGPWQHTKTYKQRHSVDNSAILFGINFGSTASPRNANDFAINVENDLFNDAKLAAHPIFINPPPNLPGGGNWCDNLKSNVEGQRHVGPAPAPLRERYGPVRVFGPDYMDFTLRFDPTVTTDKGFVDLWMEQVPQDVTGWPANPVWSAADNVNLSATGPITIKVPDGLDVGIGRPCRIICIQNNANKGRACYGTITSYVSRPDGFADIGINRTGIYQPQAPPAGGTLNQVAVWQDVCDGAMFMTRLKHPPRLGLYEYIMQMPRGRGAWAAAWRWCVDGWPNEEDDIEGFNETAAEFDSISTGVITGANPNTKFQQRSRSYDNFARSSYNGAPQKENSWLYSLNTGKHSLIVHRLPGKRIVVLDGEIIRSYRYDWIAEFNDSSGNQIGNFVAGKVAPTGSWIFNIDLGPMADSYRADKAADFMNGACRFRVWQAHVLDAPTL